MKLWKKKKDKTEEKYNQLIHLQLREKRFSRQFYDQAHMLETQRNPKEYIRWLWNGTFSYRYTQLITFESDEYNTALAKNLDEEERLIEAGFEYVRFSDKEEAAIYRKRKWKKSLGIIGSVYGLKQSLVLQ
jgi:hypothetical protein